MKHVHIHTYECFIFFVSVFLCFRKVLQSAEVCATLPQIHSTFSPAACRPLHPLARTLSFSHSPCTHTSWLLRICTPASRSAPPPAAWQRRRRWRRQTPALHGGASRDPRLTLPIRRCRHTPSLSLHFFPTCLLSLARLASPAEWQRSPACPLPGGSAAPPRGWAKRPPRRSPMRRSAPLQRRARRVCALALASGTSSSELWAAESRRWSL